MRLAVVTAAYPSAKKFFKDFFCSLEMQTDQKFDLWIGLDELAPSQFDEFSKAGQNLHFVDITPKANPIIVRNQTLECALQNSDAVALVDIDDMLLPTRVEAAKFYVKEYSLSATAMTYIGSHGEIIPGIFDPSSGDPELLLNNVFGFSNTTWCSRLLAELLPVPASCVTMDWYVSTLAHFLGASVGFDKAPRMHYRQHEANMAYVLPPFSEKQIINATRLVLKHFTLIIQKLGGINNSGYSERFAAAFHRIERFESAMAEPGQLAKYVVALNNLPANHVWWSCVAHTKLEEIWTK